MSRDGSADAPRRLVVVDDDRLFLDVFAANLRAGGYDPLCFDDPAAALDALRAGTGACACVLDLDMPRLDGLAFLHALKQEGIELPVVFVTARSAPIFEEQALRDGAVEFVDKARGPAIILHRLDRATRPHPAAPALEDEAGLNDLTVGPLLLRRRARRAVWNGVEVPLSRAEFDVVHRLVAAGGDDVPYRHIYDAIKGEGFLAGAGEEGYRANVRAMVKRIRRKFEQIDPGFAALGTYPGFGYRWRGDV
jgi:two-component system response regulator ChvI